MKIRFILLAATLMCGDAVFAAPPPAAPASTTKAPAAAVKPCPQQARHPGQGPCPCMSGEKSCPCMNGKPMPCTGMPCNMGAMPAGCPGMQAASAASKSSASGAQQVYGWQLMTPDERAAFQAKMRAAKTPEERAALRAENHRKMQERAKQQGVTLSEAPPAD